MRTDKEQLIDLVDAFALSMKAKLMKKHREGFYGWKSIRKDYALRSLHRHLEKGDMVDVANFAAFIWRKK